MDATYIHLPEMNVRNTDLGYELYRSGQSRLRPSLDLRRRDAFLVRCSRRDYIVLLGAIEPVHLGAGWLWWQMHQFQCTTSIVNRLPSPDGSAVAIIDETICEGAFPFLTVMTEGVSLAPTKPATRPVDILGVSIGGHDEGRPRIARSAPDVLRVTAAVRSYLKLLTRHASKVRIDLHFNPDDLAARAAWLKALNDPPDPVDRREKN